MAPVSNYVPSVEDLGTLPDQRYHPHPEDYVPETPGPVLLAATNEKLEILEGLLRDDRFCATSLIVGPLYGPWRSALSESILTKLPEHARVLVEHGANINGFPNWAFSSASSRFIRGRPPSLTFTGGAYLQTRNKELSTVDPVLAANQSAPITQTELALRRQRRLRFWAEPDFPRTDYPTKNPITSTTACAKMGYKSFLQSLAEHGADEYAWKTHYSSIPENAPPSYLAVKTPLQAAVEAEDEEMVTHLIGRHHKPDIFPLVLITRCINPVMLSITQSPVWLRGFDILAPHSDLELRTNTALHYLSSYRDVDDAFLAELRTLSVGGDAQPAQKAARLSRETQPQDLSDADRWPTVRNRWGFTAEELYQNGRKATSEWDKDSMPFWREK